MKVDDLRAVIGWALWDLATCPPEQRPDRLLFRWWPVILWALDAMSDPG